VDYSVIPSVQQKLRAIIASHLCHNLKWFSLNKFRVQYRIIVCHRMLSSFRESEKAKQNVVYLVKNLIQKKNLIQCKHSISYNMKNYSHLLFNFNISFSFRTARKLDDKSKHVRCVIPTKDNPPPEMSSWLLQFQVFKQIALLFLVNVIIVTKTHVDKN